MLRALCSNRSKENAVKLIAEQEELRKRYQIKGLVVVGMKLEDGKEYFVYLSTKPWGDETPEIERFSATIAKAARGSYLEWTEAADRYVTIGGNEEARYFTLLA